MLLLGGKDKGYDYDKLFAKLKDGKAVHFILYGENRFKLLNSAVRENESRITLCADLDLAVRISAMTGEGGAVRSAQSREQQFRRIFWV